MIIPNIAMSIYSVVVSASRILNLWNKLSRTWEVDTRNWNDIT
jgi:hypothetical protein